MGRAVYTPSGHHSTRMFDIMREIGKQHDMSVNEVARRFMTYGLLNLHNINFTIRIQNLEKEAADQYENLPTNVSSNSEKR